MANAWNKSVEEPKIKFDANLVRTHDFWTEAIEKYISKIRSPLKVFPIKCKKFFCRDSFIAGEKAVLSIDGFFQTHTPAWASIPFIFSSPIAYKIDPVNKIFF